MSRKNLKCKSVLILTIIFLLCFFGFSAGLAQADKEKGKEKDTRPERGIAIYTEYSGIFVSVGESVRMELTAENKGKTDENIALNISTTPQG